MIVNDFRIDDFVGSKKIYIYGATTGAKIIQQALFSKGIDIEGFLDCDKRKGMYSGKTVCRPTALDDDAVIIVGLMRSFNSALHTLEKEGIRAVYVAISLLRGYTVEDFEVLDNEKMMAESFLKDYSLYAGGFFANNVVILPVVELFITECCTLKCRDCGQFVPYYEKPISYTVSDIIDDINRLLKIVDKICEIHILGGEPLLHPQIDVLLRWIYQNPYIGSIRIISNATVYPNDNVWKAIYETETEMRFSDYGGLSKEMKRLLERCNLMGVKYYTFNEPWIDMGKVFLRKYSEEEVIDIFLSCPWTASYLYQKGRLFRCSRIANLNNQKKIDTIESDCVDLTDMIDENVDEKREELISLIKRKFMKGCYYCDGPTGANSTLEPAIQLDSGISR